MRAAVIREQLGYLHGRLKAKQVPMAIDVFGLTTTDSTDMGIGQKWEQFIDQADVVLPMTYPRTTRRARTGSAIPTRVRTPCSTMRCATRARRSAGIANAAKLVPWYQDFTLGPPRYGAEQVRAQMQAGYDNGVRGWMLWNPGSRYTTRGAAAGDPRARREERKRAPSRVRPTRARSRATRRRVRLIRTP